jgi:hypothetical protein
MITVINISNNNKNNNNNNNNNNKYYNTNNFKTNKRIDMIQIEWRIFKTYK